ncbi:MAG: oligosaccharyl transferase, archaeosortase A system-associated [Alphaproteobacteria bacterium]|nr:MAG: oligosaccharyl transferase, archaeosortase A system-associated [Alphaproteobacteria bacterium]
MSSQDRPVSSFKDKIKSSWPYTLTVAIIAFVALWIRILPANTVFLPNGIVRFVSNDAWYHMRTLNLLLNNYPNRMFYNPMTAYPYGSYIHFGPLFDQMMAIPALILGLGHPSSELVNHIGAYFPAVLGALTVVPVYYIGKYLGGRKTGVIASILIAFAPGQFLSRSMIGFVDHHAAESLFSTFFIMFFMLALISAKKNNLNFEHVLNKEFNILKEPLMYSIMAGIMYSAYQLSWPGAALFAFITLVYAVFQYILNNLRKESSDYLGIVGISIFFLSAVLLLPSVHPELGFSIVDYSWFTVAVALGVMIGFVALSLIEKAFVRKELDSRYYPLAVFGIGALGVITLSIVAPSLYSSIISAPNGIFGINTGGMSTVAEASSIFYEGGIFTLSKVYGNFTAPVFLASLLGMFILTANLFRKPKPVEVLTLVWGVFILLAIYGQNRYAYYYSVNASVLSAYVGGLLLEKVKWDELDEKFKSNVKSFADIPSFFKFIRIEQVAAVLAIIVVLILPVYGSAMLYTGGSNDPNGQWLEACMWLSSNTPDPGMDYNAIYDAPKAGETFNYPDTSYGVMSWWDYGHYIEVIGHRMPNANPFQAGIGGRRGSLNETNQPGAATFLTAQSEEEASAVLEAVDPRPDKAGARYVVSDAKMATDIFLAMPEWTLDTEDYFKPYWTGTGYNYLPSTRYYNSMEARLHIFDGNGLKQYRMVHETSAVQTQEVGYKQVYNFLFEGNIPEVNTGYVKVFEYVKGAKVTGTVSPNETVTISTKIDTGQKRTFEYSQSTTSDSQGRYEFTVPYSTEGPISGETQFDTAPSGPYKLSYGNTLKEVKVSEEAVLKGDEVKV